MHHVRSGPFTVCRGLTCVRFNLTLSVEGMRTDLGEARVEWRVATT